MHFNEWLQQMSLDSHTKSLLPRWDQDSEFWVIHGVLEGVMLGIIGDSIDPGGLPYSSLTQDEDVDVLLVILDLQNQYKRKIILTQQIFVFLIKWQSL